MDCKLIPVVLFVALCWMSVGTYAQNTTTAVPANSTNNATTVASNVTTVATNVTTVASNAPTVASNVTTLASNATTLASNATTLASNATTLASNATTLASNATTVTSNATTVTSNVTTPAPTTAAPPLVPNITVVDLPTTVSRDGCGSKQLCAAEPSSCDPAVPGSCFFLGAKPTSGRNFEFSLSGESDGFLAAVLSTGAGGNDTVYICARNKGAVKLIPAFLNNKTFFTGISLPVNNVKGKINGTKIQCTFAATVPNATARAADTAFSLGVLTGPYNDTTDSLGTPSTQLKTGVLDLTNTTQTVTNATSDPSTVAPNVTTLPPTTTAPPLVENTTVVDLPTAVSRDGCGSKQLCAAEPSSCDPSVSDSCFFFGAKQTSGHNFEFSLSGLTLGYLAASLSNGAGGNDTVYICAKNKSVVKFIPAFLNNGKIIRVSLPVNTVKGKINGNKIQCTFAATVPNATARAADTAFALGVLTGSYDDTADNLGTPTTRIQTAVLDLSNPNQTVINIANITTPNTASTITLQHSVSQALLIVLGVLSLSML